MKRWIYRYLPIFLFAALMVAALSLPTSRLVKAQDTTTVTWDFLTSDYGCINRFNDNPTYDSIMGTYVGGTGFVSNHPSDDFSRLGIQCADLTLNGVTEMRINWSSGTYRIASPNINQVVPLDLSSNFDHGTTTFDNGTWTMDTPTEVTSFSYYYDHEDGGTPGQTITSIVWTVACDGDCTPPPPALTIPLASTDMHPTWGMYDHAAVHALDDSFPDDDGREPVYAFSDKLNAHVHAVAPGTVTAVDPDITSQCETLDQEPVPFAPHACYLVLPAVIAGEAISQLFTLQMANTALVLVADDTDSTIIFTYFVTNPTVSIGDHLDASCVLGDTIPLNNSPAHLSDIDIGGAVGNSGVSGTVTTSSGLNTIQTGESVTVVRKDNLEPEIVRLLPDLTEEPDDSNCGSSNFGGCLNKNSSLLNLSNWVTSDGVDLLPGGGVTLPSGTQILQTGITVVDATNYTLNVQARSTQAGDGFTSVPKIRLFAGAQISDQPITTTWANYSFDFLGEDLSPEQAIGVVNQNFTGTDLEVRYICLSVQGTGQARSACYFNNHHFDDGPTDWEVAGGVTFDTGQAFTYNDSTIDQTVILDPIDGDTPATYNLTVAGRLIATSGYTGQTGKSVTLQYLYPSDGDYTDIGTVDSVLVDSEGKNVSDGSVKLEHPYILTIPFDVSEHTNSTLTIKTLVTDSDNYLKGFRIDYACLETTTDDGSWPGQTDEGGFVPPFTPGCFSINVPQDNNISSWIYFHWANLNRFFNCTLMIKLNSMAETIDSTAKTMRLFMRWVIAASQMSGRWMSTQVFPWLNGQFRNMAIGQVTTVYQSSGSCNDLFCVLNTLISGILTPINNIVNTVLGLINTAANLFLTVLTGIIGLGLAFLARLFSLFNQVTGLFTGIIGAYSSATPATIDGLPTCSIDPTSSPFCRAVWVLDNTILGGRWAVLLTLILGIASIHLILWVIGEFKSAIVSTGSSS